MYRLIVSYGPPVMYQVVNVRTLHLVYEGTDRGRAVAELERRNGSLH